MKKIIVLLMLIFFIFSCRQENQEMVVPDNSSPSIPPSPESQGLPARDLNSKNEDKKGDVVMKLTCAVDEIKRLTPEDIKSILDKDKKGEFILVDVRQPEEYEAGHIPGAILISLGELETRHGELDRTKKIITYCRSGRRSMAAAITLCRLGFKAVYSMEGGIIDWPYETITGALKQNSY